MQVIEVMNGVTGYRSLVDHVMRYGKRRTPRGFATLDAGPVTIVMHDVAHSLPLGIGRNVNRRIGVAEAAQLIGGYSDPQLLFDASKNFERFIEPDTGRFHGAYGVRIKNQLAHALFKLRVDHDSRQAVITIWDPWLDNLPGKRDYPCTVMMTLALVQDKLELMVVMRSQDVWLGTPFDWFQFTQLQLTAARVLGVETGAYHHITLSTHLYATNFDDVERLTDPPAHSREWQPLGLGRDGDTLEQIMWRAKNLPYRDLDNMTESERWYRDRFTPIVG